jgi:hypothetical protein
MNAELPAPRVEYREEPCPRTEIFPFARRCYRRLFHFVEEQRIDLSRVPHDDRIEPVRKREHNVKVLKGKHLVLPAFGTRLCPSTFSNESRDKKDYKLFWIMRQSLLKNLTIRIGQWYYNSIHPIGGIQCLRNCSIRAQCVRFVRACSIARAL